MNLWAILGIVVAGALSIGTAVTVVNNRAFDRGVAATEKASMEALNRMEARLREALRKNESLTDTELDCALKRLRQPNAACD